MKKAMKELMIGAFIGALPLAILVIIAEVQG